MLVNNQIFLRTSLACLLLLKATIRLVWAASLWSRSRVLRPRDSSWPEARQPGLQENHEWRSRDGLRGARGAIGSGNRLGSRSRNVLYKQCSFPFGRSFVLNSIQYLRLY